MKSIKLFKVFYKFVGKSKNVVIVADSQVDAIGKFVQDKANDMSKIKLVKTVEL